MWHKKIKNAKNQLKCGSLNQDNAKLFKMKYKILFLIIGLFSCVLSNAQTRGCTDKQANNYNSSAKENDGSCTYNKTSYKSKIICSKLSDTLIESSGLIYFNNLFWTLNDSDNPPILYAFDSMSGQIKHQTVLSNNSNTDWEDLSQDENYIYVGDFGNNNGSRKDLHILKIKKSDINLNVSIDTVNTGKIRFQFGDQSVFNSGSQNHNFDLEAMCLINDSIHLFSKNWADLKSKHYSCPTDTGFYNLSPLETLETNGLVTGAAINKNGTISLCGYNISNGTSFLYLMWDYKNNICLSGNKRRIDLGTVFHNGQNEAVCFKGNTLYMSNEKRIADAQLQRIEIEQWLGIKSALNRQINLFSSYCKDHELFVAYKAIENPVAIKIIDSSGKTVFTQSNFSGELKLDVSSWAKGVYTFEMEGGPNRKIIIE